MYNDIRETVAADFEAVNQFILAQLHSNVALIENIGHYIIDAGGKRMRPVVVLLSARGCGYRGHDCIPLAAVIEFIHTATLLHDDVVDMSSMRRGRLTANEQWNSPSSVLVGDFIYSRAFQVLVELGNMQIMEVVADTTNIIAEGEVLQLLNKHQTATGEEDYMNIIRNKTSILFQAAAHCGAILAGAEESQQDSLKRVGMHLGMAFQLMDDVLDYDGDSQAMGKNVGDDLAEGQPTLPLIHAMRQCPEDQARILRESLREGSTSQLEEVMRIVRHSGALEYTRSLAKEQARLARQCLQELPRTAYRDSLEQMIELAANRGT